MANKKITRPITLAVGILLIVFSLFNFLGAADLNRKPGYRHVFLIQAASKVISNTKNTIPIAIGTTTDL